MAGEVTGDKTRRMAHLKLAVGQRQVGIVLCLDDWRQQKEDRETEYSYISHRWTPSRTGDVRYFSSVIRFVSVYPVLLVILYT